MKSGVFLLVAMTALPGCAPTAELEPSVPPVAAPQSLLPEAYSAAPPAAAVPATPPRPVVSPASSSSIYAVAPAWRNQSITSPGAMLNPYHPQWTINVQ